MLVIIDFPTLCFNNERQFQIKFYFHCCDKKNDSDSDDV